METWSERESITHAQWPSHTANAKSCSCGCTALLLPAPPSPAVSDVLPPQYLSRATHPAHQPPHPPPLPLPAPCARLSTSAHAARGPRQIATQSRFATKQCTPRVPRPPRPCMPAPGPDGERAQRTQNRNPHRLPTAEPLTDCRLPSHCLDRSRFVRTTAAHPPPHPTPSPGRPLSEASPTPPLPHASCYSSFASRSDAVSSRYSSSRSSAGSAYTTSQPAHLHWGGADLFLQRRRVPSRARARAPSR